MVVPLLSVQGMELLVLAVQVELQHLEHGRCLPSGEASVASVAAQPLQQLLPFPSTAAEAKKLMEHICAYVHMHLDVHLYLACMCSSSACMCILLARGLCAFAWISWSILASVHLDFVEVCMCVDMSHVPACTCARASKDMIHGVMPDLQERTPPGACI